MKEIIEIKMVEQEKGTLYIYSMDGRMFVYISDGFIDWSDFGTGKCLMVTWDYEGDWKIINQISFIDD